MGSNPSQEAPLSSLSHDEVEPEDSGGEYVSSSEEDDSTISLNEQELKTKEDILLRMDDVIKMLTGYREQYNDEIGISKEYHQAAVLLVQLKESLNKLTEDEHIRRTLVKEEGARVANSGGVGILCDAVIFLFQKCNNFQDISLPSEDDNLAWTVTELLNAYLGYYSDRNPRYSRLFVVNKYFIEYSSKVLSEILTKHSTESELVS